LTASFAAGLAATLLAASGTASAQVSPSVQQVSDADTSVTVEPVQQYGAREPTAQLSNPRDSTTHESQLTAVRTSRDQPAQLTKGPPSAQPPQALSRPTEGRTGAIDRIEGADHCDAVVPKENQSAECARVIESRADDYSRPAPTQLSPEQKLLLDQQLQTAGDDVLDASRRLAASGQTDDSMESLAVAAIVLGQGQAPPDKDPTKQDQQAVDAATQAVLQILSITPPQ
jgi:hypothetical protein